MNEPSKRQFSFKIICTHFMNDEKLRQTSLQNFVYKSNQPKSPQSSQTPMKISKIAILNYSLITLFFSFSLNAVFWSEITSRNIQLFICAGLLVVMLFCRTPGFITKQIFGEKSKYSTIHELPNTASRGRDPRMIKSTNRNAQVRTSEGQNQYIKFRVEEEQQPSRLTKTFNWGERLRREISDNTSKSLLKKVMDFSMRVDSSRIKPLKSQGKPLEAALEVYNQPNYLPKGYSRIHSHSKVSADRNIKFIPREYLQETDSPIHEKLLDRYYDTIQEFKLQEINLDDRYNYVKRGIYKLLKKHNQEQASSLLMIAMCIQAFFQVKVAYENPYCVSDDQRTIGENLIEIYAPKRRLDHKKSDNGKQEPEKDYQENISYLTFSNGFFQTTVKVKENPVQMKFNEIVKNCVKNPNKHFESKGETGHQNIDVSAAMDRVFEYIRKGHVQYPPWRYKSTEHKEFVFAALKSIVGTRKQLDSFIIDMNEKSLNGKQRIEGLAKSAFIEMRINEGFIERRFPSLLYEQNRLKYEQEMGKTTEKNFLLTFFCGTLKKNLPKYPSLAASLTAPSFFNFGARDYFHFYRETGYETGEPHYNLKYKNQGKESVVHCCPGKDNFYSAVYLYFLILIDHHGIVISDNRELRSLVSELLPIQGI